MSRPKKAKKPAPAGGFLLRCPDCGHGSRWENLAPLAHALAGRVFLGCPWCDVGSPVREWRAAHG